MIVSTCDGNYGIQIQECVARLTVAVNVYIPWHAFRFNSHSPLLIRVKALEIEDHLLWKFVQLRFLDELQYRGSEDAMRWESTAQRSAHSHRQFSRVIQRVSHKWHPSYAATRMIIRVSLSRGFRLSRAVHRGGNPSCR